jgi:hypothetical protein
MLVLQAFRRSEQLFSHLIARASVPAPRVFTLKDALEVYFRCSLALELIPNVSRPNY